MKRQRLSLKDIVQEDKKIDEGMEAVNSADVGAGPPLVETTITIPKKEKINKPTTKEYVGNNNSDKIINKSEFIKMSITIEPDLFEVVDELSRQRRKRKEAYSYSIIVRDALKEYFGKNK